MPQLYVPLDVNFFDDPKVMEVLDADDGEAAVLLFLYVLVTAKRLGTDGVITWGQITKFPLHNVTDELVEKLLTAGLLEREPEARGRARRALRVTRWSRWNVDNVTRTRDQQSNAERQRRYRQRRRGVAPADDVTRNATRDVTLPREVERSEVERSTASRNARDAAPSPNGEENHERERVTWALSNDLIDAYGGRVADDECLALAEWATLQKLDPAVVLGVARVTGWPSETRAELRAAIDNEPYVPPPMTYDPTERDRQHAEWEAERADPEAVARVDAMVDRLRHKLTADDDKDTDDKGNPW